MTTLTPLQQVRLRMLKHLVEAQFGGNASAAGRKLGRSHQYLWQLLAGHRGMGERVAREIEQGFNLIPYTLDGRENYNDPRYLRNALEDLERDAVSLLVKIRKALQPWRKGSRS